MSIQTNAANAFIGFCESVAVHSKDHLNKLSLWKIMSQPLKDTLVINGQVVVEVMNHKEGAIEFIPKFKIALTKALDKIGLYDLTAVAAERLQELRKMFGMFTDDISKNLKEPIAPPQAPTKPSTSPLQEVTDSIKDSIEKAKDDVIKPEGPVTVLPGKGPVTLADRHNLWHAGEINAPAEVHMYSFEGGSGFAKSKAQLEAAQVSAKRGIRAEVIQKAGQSFDKAVTDFNNLSQNLEKAKNRVKIAENRLKTAPDDAGLKTALSNMETALKSTESKYKTAYQGALDAKTEYAKTLESKLTEAKAVLQEKQAALNAASKDMDAIDKGNLMKAYNQASKEAREIETAYQQLVKTKI